MSSPGVRAAVSTLMVAVSACGGDSGSPVDPGSQVPATVVINAGHQQQAAAGTVVPVAPSVIVRDAEGKPVPGVTVNFTVTAGGGTVTGGAPSTNGSGVATVSSWTLGPIGDQRLSAQTGSLPAVVFEAGIIPGTEQLVATMGAGGGTFRISDPDNPYDGLTLIVPAGTVTGSTEWRFGVEGQPPPISLPAGFRIAGPSIAVSTDQEFGGRLMTLEVPVETRPGELVFLALHDPISGISEIMPTVERTDSSVVVATYHLRSDFLSGPTPAVGLSAANMTIGFDGSTIAADAAVARLVPMAISGMEDVLTALEEYQTQLNRWPVQDHGSAAFPDGHGVGIAVLQAVGSTEGFPPFESIVKPLPTEGFYAEAGPLAAVQIAERTYRAPMQESIAELQQIYARHAKSERDALVVQNTVANARLNPRAAMLAGLSRVMDNRPVVGLVVGGSGGTLNLQSPAASSPTAVSVGADGMGTVRLPLVGDGPEHEVSDLVPVNSFTYRTAEARQLVETIGRMVHASTDSERDAINTQLARQAGLPDLGVEVRHFPADTFVPSTDPNEITLRNKLAELRVLVGAATIHREDGTQILTRSAGEAMSIRDDLGVTTASAGTRIGRTISVFATGAGGASRQVAVGQIRVTVAPFEVSPGEIILDRDERRVELEASVPLPPAAGFRIEWEWGDGEKTEYLGLTTASHQYEEPGSYDIVATLMTAADRQRLAVDTVRVRGKPSAWVGTATSAFSSTAPGSTWTLRSEVTNVRFELAPDELTGVMVFRPVSGQLRVWNEALCAGYVSPVVQVELGDDTERQWLNVITTDPSDPGGSPSGSSFWYRANAYTGGIEVYNKPCPDNSPSDPNPYVFSRGVVWLDTSEFSGQWRQAANRDVIEGSAVRQRDNDIQEWTWRFERVQE